MAIVTNANVNPGSGASAIFLLKALLKANGWTCAMSGDGLAAYSAVGDIITIATSGAGGLNNPGAWFVLKPTVDTFSSARHILFQRGQLGANYWRIKYSVGTAFSGGSATLCPASAVERMILTAGSDAAPLGAQAFPDGYASPNWWSGWCDSASPYGFGWHAWDSAGNQLSGFAFDCTTAAAADVDPYVFHVPTINKLGRGSYLYTESKTILRAHTGPSGSPSWGIMTAPKLVVIEGDIFPSGVPGETVGGKDASVPLVYARRSTLTGASFKGVSTYLRWHSPARAQWSLLTASTAGDRLLVGGVSFPWDGTTPLF